jgi:hypothetical protein
MVNDGWLCRFPFSEAKLLPQGLSDHASCIVSVMIEPPKSAKPFPFFEFWADDDQFLP